MGAVMLTIMGTVIALFWTRSGTAAAAPTTPIEPP
jgi:hypothetical protein